MGRLPLLPACFIYSDGEEGEVEHSEVKSDNARNVILSYNDTIYFVNSVNVRVQEGVENLKAIFHAKRASDNTQEDLDIEINQGTYDILMEYAKLDKLDLIMVLQIEGTASKWCLMSEDWLRNQLQSTGSKGYIV
jgi:hypothetical protein